MSSLHHRLRQPQHTQHTRHAQGRQPYVSQAIKRGILTSFNPLAYTANVLIMEATSAYLQGVPVACHLDGTSAQINALCAVLFFDEQNYSDAVVLAVYPNGAQGIPTPAPGRVVFVSGFQQISNVVIANGTTATFTIAGSGGIPLAALGVIFTMSFTSTVPGAGLQCGPHSVNLSSYVALGNLPSANAILSTNGLVQLDSNGKLDIKALNGSCTVNFFTQGYVL